MGAGEQCNNDLMGLASAWADKADLCKKKLPFYPRSVKLNAVSESEIHRRPRPETINQRWYRETSDVDR